LKDASHVYLRFLSHGKWAESAVLAGWSEGGRKERKAVS
jgi:hypothetical protein